MELKSILETLIFVSGKALGTSDILEVLRAYAEENPGFPIPSREELEGALGVLQEEWEARGRGIALEKIAEGYELRTRPEYAVWIRLLNRPKPQRLTVPAVESLALIAYRQPVTRGDIESVRGVDSGGVLKSLLERRLIRIVGRKEEPGRPILYATTKEFLELFGLRDLADLPPLSEFEEMIKSQAAQETPRETDISVSDLISAPEEVASLEEGDRQALEELDQSLQELKKVEKEALASAEPVPAEEPHLA